MQIAFDAIGSGPNMAAAFANGQVWPKVMTLPLFYELSGVRQHFLMNGSSTSLVVNASSGAPQYFEFQAPLIPTPFFFALAQMSIVIVDAAITPDKFGGIAALTNGVSLSITDENNVEKMNFSPTGSGGVFKKNSDFYHIGGAAIQVTGGQDMIAINWQSRLIGILGAMRPGWKVRAKVQDNMTGLTVFEISIAGALIPNDVVFSY